MRGIRAEALKGYCNDPWEKFDDDLDHSRINQIIRSTHKNVPDFSPLILISFMIKRLVTCSYAFPEMGGKHQKFKNWFYEKILE